MVSSQVDSSSGASRDAASLAPKLGWSWKDDLRLFRYNWLKRPWLNLLWRLPWGAGAEFRRTRPHNIMGRGPRLGTMTRADVEWARDVARLLPPLSSDPGDGVSPMKRHAPEAPDEQKTPSEQEASDE